jgi:hypothetical protein
VVHCAGVLDDGLLQAQTPQRFAAVMAPKVRGAWNLHTLTQQLDLDCFVLFSSIASFMGQPGQGHRIAQLFHEARVFFAVFVAQL